MRVLFVLTSHSEKGDSGQKTGYHLSEITHVYDVLNKAGYTIDFASIKGGEPPIAPDCFDLDDSYNIAFLDNSSIRQKLRETISVSKITSGDYHAVYLPGGYGAMWDFCDNAELQRIITDVYESGGIIAAVCHGQAALVNVKLNNGAYLLQNKSVICFSDSEEAENNAFDFLPFSLQQKLMERGADYSCKANFQPHVQSDERVITGQNPASAKLVGEEIIRLLSISKHNHDHFDDDESVTSPRPCCG